MSPKAVFADGTHSKANANAQKRVEIEILVASRNYARELVKEVNKDRETYGKKPFDDDNDYA